MIFDRPIRNGIESPTIEWLREQLIWEKENANLPFTPFTSAQDLSEAIQSADQGAIACPSSPGGGHAQLVATVHDFDPAVAFTLTI